MILTGAVFMAHAQLFSKIMADDLAPLRALVDELMNGEDLLMNFVVANLTHGSHLPYAEVGIEDCGEAQGVVTGHMFCMFQCLGSLVCALLFT